MSMEMGKSAVQSVLLETNQLVDAHRRASDAGKRPIGGLYHAGNRVDELPAKWDQKDAKVNGAEVQRELNMSRVAKRYNEKQHVRDRQLNRQKKTKEEAEDEESAKKAKAILDKATEQEKMLYVELFDFFDVDGDRTWGTIEFAQRMTDIGCSTSVESAANLLYFAGVRNVDRITYDDFIQMMPKLKSFRILLEKDAMRAFAAHDKNCTGFLSRHALRQVVRDLAGPDGIDEEQVHRIVKKSDRERTGKIPFVFFIKAMFGTPPILVYTPRRRKRNIIASFFGCGSASGVFDEPEQDSDDEGPRF